MNVYSHLMNLAMAAESECYNKYIMNGIKEEIMNTDLSYDYILNFWKSAGYCGKRLFLEMCLRSEIPIDKSAISYRI